MVFNMSSLSFDDQTGFPFRSYTHKHIIYQKSVRFEIYPKLGFDDARDLDIYIDKLHKDYYVRYETDCFFWKLNDTKDMIIINENQHMIDNDMINQLSMLVRWLYDRNYYVEGSFHYQIGDYIEEISMSRAKRIINYCIIKNESTHDPFYIHQIQKSEIDYSLLTKKINKIKLEQKMQSKMNDLFFKISIIFGIITVGSLLYASNKK